MNPVPRVLVVDDTASIRFLIRTNLELAGFEVDEAVDGVDCLDKLSRADSLPDAITVDVMMPRMDGVATVTAIRAEPRTAKIAIIRAIPPISLAAWRRGSMRTSPNRSILTSWWQRWVKS